MHDDGELACNGDSSALEADPLSQLQSPGAQIALGISARQDHGRRFIEQTAQMSVTTPGDMAVIIDLALLVATCGQSQPCTDRPRLPEVRRVLDGGRECGCGDRTNPGDGHEQLAGLALPCAGDKLPPKLRGAGAHAAPGFKNRQDDPGKRFLTGQQALDLGFERAAFAARNDQAERLHESADLVGQFGRDPDQPGARGHQRADQHAVIALYPHLAVKADLGQMRQAVASLASVLFGAMSSAALAWRASMQIAGSPSACKA